MEAMRMSCDAAAFGAPAPSSAASSSSYCAYGAAPETLDGELGVAAPRLYARMREVELDGRVYNPAAPYVKVRRVLVDFVCECGEELRLSGSTMHVAVGYLDKILQHADLRRDRYYLVAITCLIIAAKYEEREEGCVPSAERLVQYLRSQGQANEFSTAPLVHQMEVSILTMLNWSLTVVSPLHFLGLFHRRGLVFTTDTMGFEPLVPKVVEYLRKYSDFYSDLCLQEYSFQQYPASLLAAAIVVAARKAINIRPLWNVALEGALCYSEADVAAPYAHVWENYATHFPEDARLALKREKAAERKTAQAGLIPALPEAASVGSASALMQVLSPATGAVLLDSSGRTAPQLPSTPLTAASASTVALSVGSSGSMADENAGMSASALGSSGVSMGGGQGRNISFGGALSPGLGDFLTSPAGR